MSTFLARGGLSALLAALFFALAALDGAAAAGTWLLLGCVNLTVFIVFAVLDAVRSR